MIFKLRSGIAIALVAALLAMSGCSLLRAAPSATGSAAVVVVMPTPTPSQSSQPQKTSPGHPAPLSVHFIDVGKADSILIQAGTSAMLIDAGTPDMAGRVIDYIKAQGVEKLDYVIATHGDIDHIGGMVEVLNAFPVAQFIAPDIPTKKKEYQQLFDAAGALGLAVTTPKVGSKYRLGNAEFTIYAPNSPNYADENNYSVVLRLVLGETSFLFTGDALVQSEMEMLLKGTLASTVLKVAHHGSNEASSIEFLKAVKPKFAVLSTDRNVSGYASKKVLQRLASLGAAVYRTDDAGTITAFSDGKTVTFDKAPSPPELPKKKKN